MRAQPMMMDRRTFVQTAAGAAGLVLAPPVFPAFAASAPERELQGVSVTIRSREVIGPLPHIWEECVGSDRAAITLRESWRQDMDLARAELGAKRVRFHGILNDELGVLTKTIQRGSGTANFRNVAEVYDGLVARGLSPLVELSFMPSELASGPRTFGFYRGNVTSPKSLDDWGGFIREFVTFLVQRYGLATVAQWPIEVWNEPNLGYAFWAGTQADYFQLYKAAAVAVKAVSPQLKVGGPATSSTAWLPEFLAYCAQENAPLDFISTHVYAGDKQSTLFGPGVELPVSDVVPEAVRRARRTLSASAFPKLPLYIDEWSSDSPAMIAHVLTNVLGHADMMSHWVLSGTYEELGPVDYLLAEGAMGWALIVDGIRRPGYNTYRLMHALGDRRLAAEGPALASRRADGSFAALVWNLAEVVQPGGIPGANPKRDVVGSAKRVAVTIPDMRPGQSLSVRYVDQVRGSPLPAFRAMGAPKLPTMAQLAELRRASERIPGERLRLGADRTVTLDLPPEGVALIETV
jgi:xylan 1,4-beta-xylosidase